MRGGLRFVELWPCVFVLSVSPSSAPSRTFFVEFLQAYCTKVSGNRMKRRRISCSFRRPALCRGGSLLSALSPLRPFRPVLFGCGVGGHFPTSHQKVPQKQRNKDQSVRISHQSIENSILYPLIWVLLLGDAVFSCTFCFSSGRCVVARCHRNSPPSPKTESRRKCIFRRIRQ